jgi:hypothetical protein
MTERDALARSEILARLAVSREELRQIMTSPSTAADANGGSASGARSDAFPRSHTMQMLMSGKGLGTLGALATGLLVSRPALALRLLRLLPVSAMARKLVSRAFAAYREKSE